MKEIILKKGNYYISSDGNEIIEITGVTSTTYKVKKYEYSKSKSIKQKAYLLKDFVDLDKILAKKNYRKLSKEEAKNIIAGLLL